MNASPQEVLGALIAGESDQGFASYWQSQTEAWQAEIDALKSMAGTLIADAPALASSALLMEYPIPRRQKRVDAILLIQGLIFVLEFKVGETASAVEGGKQAEDYCLDLRDFHELSHRRLLFPIVVSESQGNAGSSDPIEISDCVAPITRTDSVRLPSSILELVRQHGTHSIIDPAAWDHSPYHPVPTIIEAAEHLFAGHAVADISHSHAGVHNLTLTAKRIVEIIEAAKVQNTKAICFVTGVPGAGKTLTGLNAVHDPAIQQGVFLSGNGPLVSIVSEALALDVREREEISLKEARRRVSTFIQNVHIFLREYWDKPESVPYDKIVVFDEAQRAWSREKSKKKFGRDGSEPDMMLGIMDRHKGWAVIVALVGGGQEIHDGEAGLSEWGRALTGSFEHWHVFVSPEALRGGASVANNALFEKHPVTGLQIHEDELLHLSIPVRSYKAQALTEWVNAVLDGRCDDAKKIRLTTEEYPLVLTRNLATARLWLKSRSRGWRRCGLLTSSGGLRHRAYGIEVSTEFHRGYPFDKWFLASANDVRSSFQLEVAATEFECQGLELDSTGLCWAGDLTWNPSLSCWNHRTFKGAKWQTVKDASARNYVLNKYRVLLTRAREGTVIWVPEGQANDPTLMAGPFDDTADYLVACGVGSLD